MEIYFSKQDCEQFDSLFASALLSADVRQWLLCPQHRPKVLSHYDLSYGALLFLLEIGQVDTMAELAGRIYDKFRSTLN